MSNNYKADQIKILKDLEAVRKRPGMFIGSTGPRGLHHLVNEVLDNSIDEVLAGYCKNIKIIIHANNSVTVIDDGRGIPVDEHPIYKKPALELVMTMLHAGGKFDHKAYFISGGLHGVGVSVVNALSEWMVVRVKRNGKIYEQKYERGRPITKVRIVGSCKGSGTLVTFKPDKEIFSTTRYDIETIKTKLRELSFLNPGLTIELENEEGKKEKFQSKGGLIEFVSWLNKTAKPLHKPIYFRKESKGTKVEIAIQYNEGYREKIFGFVNTINTVEGGTHITGFKTALTRVINDYANKTGLAKNVKIEGDDVREGLTAIVSLYIHEPQFEGQTKTRLGNSEVKGLVDSIVTQCLSQFFEENPNIAKIIAIKAVEAAKARHAAKKAKELVRRKSALSASPLPGKLADCSSRKLEQTELYIVEGESAGGSAKQARDKELQAILPLRGKILNVEKANPHKIFNSEEIVTLATAIGTGVGEHFDSNKLRYGKVIIMCDADTDGHHIETLLLTFFFRFMPQLIEQGRIYICLLYTSPSPRD